MTPNITDITNELNFATETHAKFSSFAIHKTVHKPSVVKLQNLVQLIGYKNIGHNLFAKC